MSWFSPALQQEMPIVSYGHSGFALLLVPTAGADYLEYERFRLIDALQPLIESGKMRVFSVNSVNKQSWLDKTLPGEHRVYMHKQFNDYVHNEVIPFIRTNTSPDTPVYIAGASFGALHSMNLFLKRPDLINGCIAMSGVYDLTEYSDGFYNEDVYFNSPQMYIPNLNDQWYLENIRRSNHIHLLTGGGAYEDPEASRRFSNVLWNKGIHHDLQIWGPEWKHDWPTWIAMLPGLLHHAF